MMIVTTRFNGALIALLAATVSTNPTLVKGDACKLCPVNRDTSTSTFTETPPSGILAFSGETSLTCTDVKAKLEALAADPNIVDSSPACKDAQLEAFQLACCSVPPTEYCEVCPDGSEFNKQAIVPISGLNDPSCQIAQFRYASLQAIQETGNCADTILQRTSFYCGCPGVEQECFLCPDGSTPPNLKKTDAYQTLASCQGAQFLLSAYRADECESVRPNLGVDMAAFCDCPNYVMPATEDTNGYEGCTFCPEGQMVGDPSKVHTPADSPLQRTCEQAEYFTQFITLPFTCDKMQQARDSCCVDSKSSAYSINGPSMMMSSLMLAAGIMFVDAFF